MRKEKRNKEIRWCINNRESAMGVSNKHSTQFQWSQLFLESNTPLFLHEALSMILLTCRHHWCVSPRSWHANWWGIGNDMHNDMLRFEHSSHGALNTFNYNGSLSLCLNRRPILEQRYSKTVKCERNNLLLSTLRPLMSIYRCPSRQRQTNTRFQSPQWSQRYSTVFCGAKRSTNKSKIISSYIKIQNKNVD